MSGRGVKAMVMHGFSNRQRSSLQRESRNLYDSRMLPWTSTWTSMWTSTWTSTASVFDSTQLSGAITEHMSFQEALQFKSLLHNIRTL